MRSSNYQPTSTRRLTMGPSCIGTRGGASPENQWASHRHDEPPSGPRPLHPTEAHYSLPSPSSHISVARWGSTRFHAPLRDRGTLVQTTDEERDSLSLLQS